MLGRGKSALPGSIAEVPFELDGEGRKKIPRRKNDTRKNRKHERPQCALGGVHSLGLTPSVNEV